MCPRSDSARTARYRRLQSWYREVQLGVTAGGTTNYPTLGSLLHPDAVAEQRDLNFLHPAAYLHAEQRKVEVQEEGGALEQHRLFHNMLSSMPLCFNLFGAMRDENDFLEVFKALFDQQATRITEIICEWAPREESARIGDKTAFDAVVFYETTEGPRFFGIETKYTEPFSQFPYATNPQCLEVTQNSGWFRDPEAAFSDLKGSKSNQLWRNVMLAAKFDAHGSNGRGSVAVVALQKDSGAEIAFDSVSGALSDSHKDRLKSVSIEAILDKVNGVAPGLSWWATSFRRRYVDFGLPDDPKAGRDPNGPVAGRSIARTVEVAREAPNSSGA